MTSPLRRQAAAVSGTLRGFLPQATGVRAQYMQLDAIAASELQLGRTASRAAERRAVQCGLDAWTSAAASESAEELIRSWT